MSRKDNERTQARVGLASNILGITAGAAALGTAVKNPALRRPSAENAGPVTRRVLHKIKSPRGKAALIAGGAGGAIALQAANLGGDFVSNRVLSREAKMSKSIEQSIVSKSDDADRGTGIGMNLEKAWKGEPGDKRNTKYAASSLIGGVAVPAVGAALGPLAYGIYRSGEESETRRKASIKRRKAEIAARIAAKKKKSHHVEKRNFNAEADRQRRLGAYTGLGLGTGVVAGTYAVKGLKPRKFSNAEGRIMALEGPAKEMSRKWVARRAGLATLAAAGVGGGVAAYARGVGVRNRPYS